MPLPAIFAVRAFGLWVVARLAVLIVTALGGGRPIVDLAPPAAVLMAAVVVLLGLVDVAQRRERALLENFGVRRLRLLAWLAVPPLLAETAFAAARRVFA